MTDKDIVVQRGIVKKYAERQTGQKSRIWQFLLLQENSKTGKKRHLPVRVNGSDMSGVIMEDNELEITGYMNDGNLIPEKIVNHSLNSSVVTIHGQNDDKVAGKFMKTWMIVVVGLAMSVFVLFGVVVSKFF